MAKISKYFTQGQAVRQIFNLLKLPSHPKKGFLADITIYYRDKIDNEKVLLDTKAEMLVYARDKNASEIIQAGLSFKNFIEHVLLEHLENKSRILYRKIQNLSGIKQIGEFQNWSKKMLT